MAMILKVDKKLVAKLPKYAQSWKWIQLEKTSGSCVDAICEQLPGDNRGRDCDVCFMADNFAEFKWEVSQYRKSYARFGYDY